MQGHHPRHSLEDLTVRHGTPLQVRDGIRALAGKPVLGTDVQEDRQIGGGREPLQQPQPAPGPVVGHIDERVVEIPVHDEHLLAQLFDVDAVDEKDEEIHRVDEPAEWLVPQDRIADPPVGGTEPARRSGGGRRRRSVRRDGAAAPADAIPQGAQVGVHADVIVDMKHGYAAMLLLERDLETLDQRGFAGAVEARKRDQHWRAASAPRVRRRARRWSASREPLRHASNSSSVRRRPCAANSRRRPSSASIPAMASVSAATSAGGTRTPQRPSSSASGMPATRDATTGVPTAIASRSTLGSPSPNPGDGWTKIVARLMASRTSANGSQPRNRTRSPRPKSRARAASAARSGPSPTSSTSIGVPRALNAPAARSRWSKPLARAKRPTASTVRAGRPSGR